jgi:predicted enzyme related to lactoylglutathione lyase
MIRRFAFLALVLSPGLVTASPQAPASPAPIVFFDIAGPDSARLSKFYSELFTWKIGTDGGFSAPVTTPLQAVIRQDPAATVLYVGVDDVTATLNKVVANGGTVVFPRLVVPGRVIIGMFKDPAGNQIGLVEMKDGKAKVP